jgi:hypothetical protein
MSDLTSITVLPKTGAIYSGNLYSEDAGEFIAGYNNSWLASIEATNSMPPVFSGTTEKDNVKALEAALHQKKGYQITDVEPRLFEAQKLKLKMGEVGKKLRGSYNASAAKEMNSLQQQYEAVVNGTNTNQVTIVQFVNEIIGKLEQPSFITTAFKHISLDRLRGKIPEMGWPAVNLQVSRLSEPEISATEFGQAEFRILRNDVHIYTSREDRMEATIDPHAVSISQGQIQMLRARELLALKECSTLNYAGDGTYGELPDFTATGTEGVPHGTNDGPKAFVNAIVSHFNTYFNYLKYFIWNPLDYRDYLSNWFSFAYNGVEAPQGFGVTPMRGLEKYGCIAIISPYVPQGYVYALTSEGAYELDGPYIVDSEYDAKKFADYNIVHDFIGYKIHNPKRFGEKLKITTSPPGTEITTNLQVYNKLAPPSDIVIKNANA